MRDAELSIEPEQLSGGGSPIRRESTITCADFCRKIIHGPGGMADYERYEWVVWSEDIRVHAAEWALRCVSNPRCEGSDVAFRALIARRAELGDVTAAGVLDYLKRLEG